MLQTVSLTAVTHLMPTDWTKWHWATFRRDLAVDIQTDDTQSQGSQIEQFSKTACFRRDSALLLLFWVCVHILIWQLMIQRAWESLVAFESTARLKVT
jgi:hypothetical protein